MFVFVYVRMRACLRYMSNVNTVLAKAVSEGADLTGKVAFVTGVTSGIGKETARVLALRGAHVILASRNVQKLNATKAALEKSLARSGKTAKFDILQLDLGDLDSVRAAAAKFKEMGLGLHLLINNAGNPDPIPNPN